MKIKKPGYFEPFIEKEEDNRVSVVCSQETAEKIAKIIQKSEIYRKADSFIYPKWYRRSLQAGQGKQAKYQCTYHYLYSFHHKKFFVRHLKENAQGTACTKSLKRKKQHTQYQYIAVNRGG